MAPKMKGIIIITLAWMGSGGVGLSLVWINIVATMSYNGSPSGAAAAEEIKDCVYSDVHGWQWPSPGWGDKPDAGVAYIEFRAGY